MNTFVNAIKNQNTETENGMRAKKSTSDACVDFFFKAGAMRGQDIIPVFLAAYIENQDLAIRITLWLRDIREGAGERESFRKILQYLSKNNKELAVQIMQKIPELGRWDDVLYSGEETKKDAYVIIAKALLDDANPLAAKWMPRKGVVAYELRSFLGLTPKQYRKLLVSLTNVVETKMCAKNWKNINFSQVPSLASVRYRKAFERNSKAYLEYAEKLSNKDSSVKINANAVFPHDILSKNIAEKSSTEIEIIKAQWEALPNYVNNASILPLVDVSASMESLILRKSSKTCMDIAIALGLYLADKNKGSFNGTFLTFSSEPELHYLQGNIVEKYLQMKKSNWDMSTNLESALNIILNTAIDNTVPQEEMPSILLILSDMQFDQCVVNGNDSALKRLKKAYKKAGYIVPKVVFWNLKSYDNVPTKADKEGVALISGFSPSILKSILSDNLDNFTPYNIMLETVLSERYNYR